MCRRGREAVRRLVAGSVLAAALAGCGGGGGGGGSVGGSTSPGAGSQTACVPGVTTGFAADFNLVQANSGDAGGDGGGSAGAGGGGGGAAAGGGFGKVTSALMRVSSLADGSVIGEALTDPERGLVTVKTCGRSGPFLLTLSGRAGAQYYDEGRDRMLDFGADTVVHAMVDRWDEHVGVSPLSEAAYRYALNNFVARPADIQNGRATLLQVGDIKGLTVAQVQEANGRVRAIANLMSVSGYAIDSVKSLSTPIDSSSTNAALGNNTYSMSAVVLGGLVKAAAEFNPALERPALDLTASLARDLTDGRLDGFALDGSPAAAAGRQAYPYNAGVPLWTGLANNAIEARFGGATRNVTPQIVDVVPDMTYYRQLPNNQNYQSIYNDPVYRIVDTAVLMSDGTVRLRRVAAGTTTVDQRFMTGVKRIFSSRSPNLSGGQVNSVGAALDRMVQQAYVLKNDGTVWVWGSSCFCLEGYLQTGDGDIDENNRRLARTFIRWDAAADQLPAPVQVPGLRDIVDISISPFGEKYLALDARGRVFTWGRDVGSGWIYRSIGSGGGGFQFATRAYVNGQQVSTLDYATANGFTTAGCIARPVEVAGMGNVISVVSGVNANLALNSSGEVYAWGMGDELGMGKQLGLPDQVAIAPTRVALPTSGPVRLLVGTTIYSEGRTFNVQVQARMFRSERRNDPPWASLGDLYGWGNNSGTPAFTSFIEVNGVDGVDFVQSSFSESVLARSGAIPPGDETPRLGFDGQIVPISAGSRTRDGVPTLEYLSDKYPALPLVHRIKQVDRDVWMFGRDGRVYVYGGFKSTGATAPLDITSRLQIQ